MTAFRFLWELFPLAVILQTFTGMLYPINGKGEDMDTQLKQVKRFS